MFDYKFVVSGFFAESFPNESFPPVAWLLAFWWIAELVFRLKFFFGIDWL